MLNENKINIYRLWHQENTQYPFSTTCEPFQAEYQAKVEILGWILNACTYKTKQNIFLTKCVNKRER